MNCKNLVKNQVLLCDRQLLEFKHMHSYLNFLSYWERTKKILTLFKEECVRFDKGGSLMTITYFLYRKNCLTISKRGGVKSKWYEGVYIMKKIIKMALTSTACLSLFCSAGVGVYAFENEENTDSEGTTIVQDEPK